VTYTYPFAKPRGRLHFDQIVSKAYWSWRANPAIMVPTMIASSIAVLTQSIFVIFATILLIQLETSGTLGQITSDLTSGNSSVTVAILLSPPVLYEVVGFLGAAFIVAAIVSVLSGGATYSSEFMTYKRVLGGEHVKIGSVMSALKEKWKKMAWTLFLVQVFTYAPLAALLIAGVAISVPFGVSSIFSLLGFLILGLIFTVILMFLFMYSLVAVAIDDLSGMPALKKSYHVARENFGISGTYAIVRVLLYGLITGIASLASTLGLPLTSIASIAVTLLLVPILHLSKTTIYEEIPKQTGMEFEIYGPTSSTKDLFGGPFFRFAFQKLKHGMVQLKNFAFDPRNLPYHAASAAGFLLGVWIGLYIGKNGLDAAILGLGYAPGQINPTILNAVPLSEGFDIFLHNWQVSLSTALSGLWFVAPSLVTLGFNGMVLGAVYYLTPNFTMFAAAIFPHGIIEIPSFVLAGSAGTRLGIAFLKTFGKGKDSPENARFEAVARQTIYVLIGIAVLFLVAGFIEGNITPLIMRDYGWR
jgi:stage II sporulation protein M